MDQWFLAGDSFAPPPSPRGDSWRCVDTFNCHNYGGAADTQLVEARNTCNSPTLHRTAGAAKNDQAQKTVVLRSRNPDVDSYISQYYTWIDASISRFLNLSRNW